MKEETEWPENLPEVAVCNSLDRCLICVHLRLDPDETDQPLPEHCFPMVKTYKTFRKYSKREIGEFEKISDNVVCPFYHGIRDTHKYVSSHVLFMNRLKNLSKNHVI